MFFENTVQTGYAFWAGLAKVFCSQCPSWTLVGRFHPPTLCSPPAHCPYLVTGSASPYFITPIKDLPLRQHLNLPKDSFHCASCDR